MWIVWAVACSVLNAAASALTKRIAHENGAIAVTFWTYALSVPVLLALLAFAGAPEIGRGFWPALAVGVGANLVAITLRNLGLKLSPLSLGIPLLSFTPAFLLASETLILGDHPGPPGVAGILLIVAGTYTLNLRARTQGPLEPLRVIARQRGLQLMLVVAALWSLTSVIDKICVTRSSPLFYVAAFHVGFTLGYLPVVGIRRRLRRPRRSPGVPRPPVSRARLARYLAVSLLHTGSIVAQMLAIQLTLVSYVIAIKRSGMLFSVLIGGAFFGETGIGQRLAGALLMCAGVALILLG